MRSDRRPLSDQKIQGLQRPVLDPRFVPYGSAHVHLASGIMAADRARMLSELWAALRARITRWQYPSRVTRGDVRIAYVVAVAVDAAQFLLGPFGWVGFDEILDAAAMVVISRLIGFHPLFLPTFVLEFVPFTDMLPTWTGCVALVVRARRRQGVVTDDVAPAIDVKAKRVE